MLNVTRCQGVYVAIKQRATGRSTVKVLQLGVTGEVATLKKNGWLGTLRKNGYDNV